MKTLKILFIFILIASFVNIYAQDDDTKIKDKKHKHKIKVKIHDLPNEMAPGSSVDVTVTVTNKSNVNTWEYTGKFTCTIEGPFTFTNSAASTEFSLNPSESKDLIYKLTAPTQEGKHKITIVFWDGDKKAGSKTKNIKVGTTTKDDN